MKFSSTQIFKFLSLSLWLIAVFFPLSAYFKMDKLLVTAELQAMSGQFQIFVWGIILSATGSFFIAWRMTLKLDTLQADFKDNIKGISIDDLQTEDSDEKPMEVNWSLMLKPIQESGFEAINWERYISLTCKIFKLDLAIMFTKQPDQQFINTYNFALLSHYQPSTFTEGEGINGQAVKNKQPIHIKDIPENYVRIGSASGSVLPTNIYIMPLIENNEVKVLIEFADMKTRGENTFNALKELAKQINAVRP